MFYANGHKYYSELSLKDLHDETLRFAKVFEPTLFETISIKDYEENCIKYDDKFIVDKEWLSYMFVKNVYKIIKYNVDINYLTLNMYINTFPEMFVPLRFTIRNSDEKIKILNFKSIQLCKYLTDLDIENYYIVPITNLCIKTNKELFIVTKEKFNELLDKLPTDKINSFKMHLFEYYGSEILEINN